MAARERALLGMGLWKQGAALVAAKRGPLVLTSTPRHIDILIEISLNKNNRSLISLLKCNPGKVVRRVRDDDPPQFRVYTVTL